MNRSAECKPSARAEESPWTENVSAGVVALDERLIIRNSNRSFQQILGIQPADAHGHSIMDFVDPASFAVLTRQVAESVAEDSTHVGRCIRLTAGDGSSHHAVCEIMAHGGDGRSDGPRCATLVLHWARQQSPSAGQEPLRLRGVAVRVLELVADGRSSQHIAMVLHLSRQGVDYHVASLIKRLRVSNRSALISKAYHMGVLTPGLWPPRVSPDFIAN